MSNKIFDYLLDDNNIDLQVRAANMDVLLSQHSTEAATQ